MTEIEVSQPFGAPHAAACDSIHNLAALHGMHLARGEYLDAAHALAQRLIDPGIAELELVRAVQERTGSAVFVHQEQGIITGMLGLLCLSSNQLTQLRCGSFDGRRFDPSDLAEAWSVAAGAYVWAVAASTKPASRVIVRGGKALVSGLIGDRPVFARAATNDGERVLESLGFMQHPASRNLMLLKGGSALRPGLQGTLR